MLQAFEKTARSFDLGGEVKDCFCLALLTIDSKPMVITDRRGNGNSSRCLINQDTKTILTNHLVGDFDA